jgi:SAM-dependent methyltransferase
MIDDTSPPSYDPDHFPRLAAVERRHFWFRARRRAIQAVLAPEVVRLPSGYRVLDVGCGTGSIVRTLEAICDRGTVIGMDLFREGLRFVEPGRRTRFVQADLQNVPFRARFDVVGLFDVIEHFIDDVALIASMRVLVRDGGLLILTVPAQPSLWSDFDVGSDHKRRYVAEELRAKLVQSGFELLFLSPYMCTIYPLVWTMRRLAFPRAGSRWNLSPRLGSVKRELRVVPVVNELLCAGLRWEAFWLGRRKRLPLGTSLIALARTCR